MKKNSDKKKKNLQKRKNQLKIKSGLVQLD